MKRKSQTGAAYVEFCLCLLVLIPMLLGTGGIGLTMHKQLQTVQLARDAGRMFARGIDFTVLGNQQVLADIGGSLGLSTTLGSGSAVVILSTIRYVDVSACQSAGCSLDTSGNPIGCTNYKQWAFAQRQVIGNGTVHASTLGTPPNSIIGTGGVISITNAALNSGDVANIGSIFTNFSSELPSGTLVYVSEASATGFRMPPFTGSSLTYSRIYF
jgi:hypothetical protein